MAKKEEGNAQIKLGNYQAAYDIYTEALEVDTANVSLNSKLYCNRALAASKVVCVATVTTVTTDGYPKWLCGCCERPWGHCSQLL